MRVAIIITTTKMVVAADTVTNQIFNYT